VTIRQSRFVNAAELDHIRAGGDDPAIAKKIAPSGVANIRFFLTNRTLLANYWAYFVYGYFLFFFMTWLPSYLEHDFGLKLADVGLFTVSPWLAAAAALWAIGRASDHLLRKTGRLRVARSYLIAGTQLVAALAVIPVALTHDLATAIACITLAVAASMGANAVYFAVNVDIIPARAASAFGIMNLAFAISGVLAPYVTGEPARLVRGRVLADGRAGISVGHRRSGISSSGQRPAQQVHLEMILEPHPWTGWQYLAPCPARQAKPCRDRLRGYRRRRLPSRIAV
jgi:hypothetical protein